MSLINKKNLCYSLLTIVIVAVAGAVYLWQSPSHNPDALWHLISDKCAPGMRDKGNPAPCSEVNVDHGYVTLKDRHGILQYLLMPLDKIAGTESPQLLQDSTPNLFALAWDERQLAKQAMKVDVPDSALSLAINSAYGRTQNQMHIHISCLRPDIRQQLDALSPTLNEQWQHHEMDGDDYLLRAVSDSELHQQSAFIRLAREVPDAADAMGRYGLALATLADDRLVLMTTRASLFGSNNASPELLQDHDCGLLHLAAQ